MATLAERYGLGKGADDPSQNFAHYKFLIDMGVSPDIAREYSDISQQQSVANRGPFGRPTAETTAITARQRELAQDPALAKAIELNRRERGFFGSGGAFSNAFDETWPFWATVAGGALAGGAGAETGAGARGGVGLGEGIGADAYFAGAGTGAGAGAGAGEFSLAGGATGYGLGGNAAIPAVGGTTAAGAGTAAAGTALSRIIDGTATTQDWVSVLGTAGATGLGMYSAGQRESGLEAEAARQRAERAPYLQASQGWLANPQSYLEGPGQAAMNATLQGLSVRGNPLGSGTSLGIANTAALGDWRNAVTGMGNLGLGGQNIQANLMGQAGQAGADIWGNLAGGISDIINPRRSLADLMREYKIGTGG